MIFNAPIVIWFTGLSGSGKTSLSFYLISEFKKLNCSFKLLDGDLVRKGINKDLTYSMADRKENIRRLAEINILFLEFGISVINSFIMPTEDLRILFRSIIKDYKSFEIYLSTPLKVCIERDPKGHYQRTMSGQVKSFTGIDSPYESSTNANLILNTSDKTIEECTHIILKSCFDYFIKEENHIVK